MELGGKYQGVRRQVSRSLEAGNKKSGGKYLSATKAVLHVYLVGFTLA